MWVAPLYIPKTTSFFTLCFEAFIDYDPVPTFIVQTLARIVSDKHGESLVFFSCSTEWVRHVGIWLGVGGSGTSGVHDFFLVAAHQNFTTSPKQEIHHKSSPAHATGERDINGHSLAVLLVVYHWNFVAISTWAMGSWPKRAIS